MLRDIAAKKFLVFIQRFPLKSAEQTRRTNEADKKMLNYQLDRIKLTCNCEEIVRNNPLFVNYFMFKVS